MLFNEEGKQEAVMILAGAEVTDEVFYFNTDGSFTLEEERHSRLLFAVLQTGFAKSLSVRDGCKLLLYSITTQLGVLLGPSHMSFHGLLTRWTRKIKQMDVGLVEDRHILKCFVMFALSVF